MKVTFYGSLADAIGREIEVPIKAGETIGGLRGRIAALHPSAAPILLRPAIRACIDDLMADDDAPVPAGAEVAFLPPLSGG